MVLDNAGSPATFILPLIWMPKGFKSNSWYALGVQSASTGQEPDLTLAKMAKGGEGGEGGYIVGIIRPLECGMLSSC